MASPEEAPLDARTLSRRRFALGAAGALTLPMLAACGSAPPPTPKVEPTPPPTAVSTREPATATPVPPTPTPRPPRGSAMTTPDFSVHVFLWGAFETTRRDLGLVKEMGFGWVKQRFEWRYVEPHVKGKYDWAEPDRIVDAIDKADLKVIARIDNQPKWTRNDDSWPTPGPPEKLSDWADFLGAMTERYRGRIQAYEIWNEPNLAREWGNQPPNPREYVEMLKVAHRAIKKADPDALVITAGLSPTTTTGRVAMPDLDFAKAMYAAGARDYFDMFGVHAAGFKAPPELSPDEIARDRRYNNGEGAAGRIYGFRHVEDLRQVMVANGDASKRVAVLEFGWTSDPRPQSPYHWHAVSEEEKADYLVRAFDFARTNWQPWIGSMTAIYIADPAWGRDHEQWYWSITSPDGTVRPAYRALAGMKKDAAPAPLTIPVSLTAEPTRAPVNSAAAPAATKPPPAPSAASKPSSVPVKPAAGSKPAVATP